MTITLMHRHFFAAEGPRQSSAVWLLNAILSDEAARPHSRRCVPQLEAPQAAHGDEPESVDRKPLILHA